MTLVATGPLTNLGLLLRAAPDLHERIGEIVVMGGSLGAGNTTPSAEFNIWADPEAAAIVFEAGLPLRMTGLDVTHQALLLPDDVAALEALGTRAGRVFAELMRFFAIHHRDRYGWDGPPVHDAVAVAWLLEPTPWGPQRLRVDIDTSDGPSRGRTIADPEGLTGRPPNVEVGLTIDRERLMGMLVDAVGRLEPVRDGRRRPPRTGRPAWPAGGRGDPASLAARRAAPRPAARADERAPARRACATWPSATRTRSAPRSRRGERLPDQLVAALGAGAADARPRRQPGRQRLHVAGRHRHRAARPRRLGPSS